MSARTAERLLADAGPTMTLPDVATVLGLSRTHCYDLAREGKLPFRILTLGSRMVVSTAELRRLLDGGSA